MFCDKIYSSKTSRRVLIILCSQDQKYSMFSTKIIELIIARKWHEFSFSYYLGSFSTGFLIIRTYWIKLIFISILKLGVHLKLQCSAQFKKLKETRKGTHVTDQVWLKTLKKMEEELQIQTFPLRCGCGKVTVVFLSPNEPGFCQFQFARDLLLWPFQHHPRQYKCLKGVAFQSIFRKDISHRLSYWQSFYFSNLLSPLNQKTSEKIVRKHHGEKEFHLLACMGC